MQNGDCSSLREITEHRKERESMGAVPGWHSQSPGLLPQVQEEEEDKGEKEQGRRYIH